MHHKINAEHVLKNAKKECSLVYLFLILRPLQKDLDASIGRQSRFWRELKQCIKKPLSDHLLEDKNLVFAITKCNYNHSYFSV